MKKQILLILFFAIAIISYTQTMNPRSLSYEELVSEKKTAIEKEDYLLAEKISNELKKRNEIELKLSNLQNELDLAVANENYEKASNISNELKILKGNIEKLESLRSQLKFALEQENYATAAIIIEEITILEDPNQAKEEKTSNTEDDLTQTNVVLTPLYEVQTNSNDVYSNTEEDPGDTNESDSSTNEFETNNSDLSSNTETESQTITNEAYTLYTEEAKPQSQPTNKPKSKRREELWKSRVFIAYNGTPEALYGFMVGSDGGMGFYLAGRVSGFGSEFSGLEKSYEECDESGIIDGVGEYVYRDYYIKSRGSITVGLTQQVQNYIHGYLGLGYGYSNYWYLFDHYESDGTYWDQRFAKYTPLSEEGLEFEAGVIFDFNSIMFSIGYTSVNFKTFDVTFGLGVSF